MKENSQSILLWGDETFGNITDPVTLAQRANIEMAELIEAIENDDPQEIAKEAADIVILLHRLLAYYGKDLSDEVDHKMVINRSRKWELSGDGTGNHIAKSDTE